MPRFALSLTQQQKLDEVTTEVMKPAAAPDGEEPPAAGKGKKGDLPSKGKGKGKDKGNKKPKITPLQQGGSSSSSDGGAPPEKMPAVEQDAVMKATLAMFNNM